MTPRKLPNDDKPTVPVNNASSLRTIPPVSFVRSRSFHSEASQASSNTSDDANLLRSYKVHLDQILHRDGSSHSSIKTPNYTSVEDIIKANEVFILKLSISCSIVIIIITIIKQLLLENDRLRSELNRLKTESTLLLRSMKTATGVEPILGNERVRFEVPTVLYDKDFSIIDYGRT